MTRAELKRRIEVWKRINDLKDSKNALISQQKLDDWREQSLPGEITRSADLGIENPSKVRKGDTWSNIHTAISLTIDQRPKIQFIAAEENDVPKSIVLQNILDYIWDKGKGDNELYYTVLSAARYGTGIAKCFYRCDKRKVKDIKKYNFSLSDNEIKTRSYEKTSSSEPLFNI